MRSLRVVAVACGMGLVALSALAQTKDQPVPIDKVDGQAIINADQHPGEWLSYGRDYQEQRFSPLKQINTGNAKQLGLTWYADLGSTRGLEATPLVVDGILYDILPWNITLAFYAKTGKQLWRYDPQVSQRVARIACCDIDARGIAAWKGKIILPTLDGRLIALNAKTGQPVWSVNTFDDGAPWPLVITGAPRVFDGKVLIGNSGAEAASRGYVTAYDAETGKKLWRFYMIPGNPVDRAKEAPNQQKADAVSAPTWTGEWWKVGGGGTPWDSIVYDPKLRLVYIGGGNGGPWAQHYRSPGGGDNLFLASIVAVNVDTGDYVWHYQETPGDEWDYTATQPMILADLKIDGKLRHVLMQAPKNGYFYVLDRETGKLISAQPFARVTWSSGIDMKTGRPIFNPSVYYGETPEIQSPSAGGAHNWQPMAYSPLTGLAYLPVTLDWKIFALDPDFKQQPGAMSQLGMTSTGHEEERKALIAAQPKNSGFLVAYDPVAQKERWRVPYPRSGSGGVLVTAGNLVFEGTINTTFAAYNATTGEKVWEMPVQQVPISGPVTYTVDGEQYVAVNAGYGGGLVHGPVNDDSVLKNYPFGRLLVFKLNGTAQLPPFTPTKPKLEIPPRINVTSGEALKGEALFQKNCAVCHGDNARGGVKDLRRMSRQTHDEFFDIVLGGKRAANGMASFADTLSHADAELIHKFLITRTNEDWDELNAQ